MSVASMGFGDPGSKQAMYGDEAAWARSLSGSMEWLRKNVRPAVASPNTLIVQLGNEKTPGSNKLPGEVVPEQLARARRHAADLVVHAYNLVKPLAPTLPLGYANQDVGFLAPDCMDLYMHNSFLTKDRYGRTWDDILRWQGCLPPDGPNGQGRPFVNSEFGANRYLPQAYHAGPNNPFLEKIHAWNFPSRWKEFMENGTAGGLAYCLYDLDSPRDQGSSRFGLLTFEGQPKLASWEVGHMWRDFELERRDKDVVVTFKRDYHARDCHLTITTADGTTIKRRLEDFAPRSTRTITDLAGAGGEAGEFRWQLDFTTHAGLVNQARGVWPAEAEARDFLEKLKTRDTYPFLRELFDAEVTTADGRPAPPTLAEMALPRDGIIPVALRKPNGVTYLLLISRENPERAGGPLKEGVTIDLAFAGKKVEKVDDTTGQPLPEPVDAAPTPGGGLRLTNVHAARIPGAIGERSETAFKLPIYRISP